MRTLKAWALLSLCCFTGCKQPQQPAPIPVVTSTPEAKSEKGLLFTLKEVPPAEPQADTVPAGTPTPLPKNELQTMTRRLPPLQNTDPRPFRLLDGPSPPKARLLKPPTEAKPVPKAETTELRVTGVSPKGPVEMAPQLTVSFNQPMIALAGLEDLDDKTLPVKLTPQPAGKWRWLGTDTLTFQPTERFPMSTKYQVDITAGTTSASGQRLVKGESFTFETPSPKLEEHIPDKRPQSLEPVVFLRFNQEIDPEAVISHVNLSARGNSLPLRLATAQEVNSDQVVRQAAESSGKTWLACKAQIPLTPGTTYEVAVGGGTPSAEGPAQTTSPQAFTFATYDPLAVEGRHTQAGIHFTLRFNNDLDPRSFDASLIKVTPLPENLSIDLRPRALTFFGNVKSGVPYAVELPATLKDRHGQTWGNQKPIQITAGPPEPKLVHPEKLFVLDTKGKHQLPLQVQNMKDLKVKIWRVQPEDWTRFFDPPDMDDNEKEPPGHLIFKGHIKLNSPPDEVTDLKFDLSPYLKGKPGHLIVRLAPSTIPTNSYPDVNYTGWIQSTHIGLDAINDGHQIIVWASDLATGKSLRGVQVQRGRGESVRTGADGLARLPATNNDEPIAARLGLDTALLASGSVEKTSDQPIFFSTDDRKLYRPGEEMALKGWVRIRRSGPAGDLTFAPRKQLKYKLTDSQGTDIAHGVVPVGRLGGFHLRLKLPTKAELGPANLRFQGGKDEEFTHQFLIEEFKRPEFEVTASSEPSAATVGEHIVFRAVAKYFSSGPLAKAKVKWVVQASATNYSPPGWSEFSFGATQRLNRPTRETLETQSDAAGKCSVRADFQSIDKPQPQSVMATATVTDVNRHTWTASARAVVHPCHYYAGLKSSRAFVQKGEPLELSSILVDPAGKAVPGKCIKIHAYRVERQGNETRRLDETTQTVTSASEPVAFKIATGESGIYRVEASVQDSENRSTLTQIAICVAGEMAGEKNLNLIPDKSAYEPGDTAQILVQAPTAPAQLLVTRIRGAIVSTERISAPSGCTTLRVPIRERDIPNLIVRVDAVGQEQYSASADLNVSEHSRALHVAVQPRSKILRPAGKTVLDVQVKDAKGKPVSQADVAIFVVDDSVLALSGFLPENPLSSFHPRRESHTLDAHLRDHLTLSQTHSFLFHPKFQVPEDYDDTDTGFDEGTPFVDYNNAVGSVTGALLDSYGFDLNGKEDELIHVGGNYGHTDYRNGLPLLEGTGFTSRAVVGLRIRVSDDIDAGAEFSAFGPHNGVLGLQTVRPHKKAPAFKLRSDFNPLALFAPSLTTDAKGQAHVALKLPDSLTRYHILALAAAGTKQFGKGESAVTSRKELMIRPSAPRFLNYGDRFQLPIILQNQTDHAMRVSLIARASNAELATKGLAVNVPANDRVEVRLPARAAKPGTARFQFAATAGQSSDAAEISLPVYTPATTEETATYGVVDGTTALSQALQKPQNVIPDFGGLSVTTSSTALTQLTDSFSYLNSYPFQGNEELASRILANLAFDKTANLDKDLAKLKSLQNEDGGWDSWTKGQPSSPFLTVHVTHALVRAHKAPASALQYLKDISYHFGALDTPQARLATRAYAVYVRHLAGKPDLKEARALLKEKLIPECYGWLLPTLTTERAQVLRYLENHVTQTASSAHYISDYSQGSYLVLHSELRDDAVLLDALLEARPTSPLIPKLVRGLLDARRAGRWESTQENCWALLALGRYFHKFESEIPNFLTRLWLGQSYAGQQQFQGRRKPEQSLAIPTKAIESPLTLSKTGPGRLYYRLGLQYAPTDLHLPAADYGFKIGRTFEAVKDNRDVSLDKDGIWHIKAGALVKITVTMSVPSRRYHVALVDPLPAGFETENPDLRGSETRKTNQFQWFNHQNLRDDRAEAFTQILDEGVYVYTVTARATTPGEFLAPPAKAEEMYHPETFGRSQSDRVKID